MDEKHHLATMKISAELQLRGGIEGSSKKENLSYFSMETYLVTLH